MSSVTPEQAPKRPARKKMSQERMMVMFTLFFMIGIVLLVVVPAEQPWIRGVVMTVYSVSMFWLMFKFGM